MSLAFYIRDWEPILKTMTEDECEKVEFNRRHARRQVKEIIRENILSCDCDFETTDLKTMIEHFETCKYSFGLGGAELMKRFNEMNLWDYRKQHTCSTCEYCGKTFTDPKYGGKHLLNQHQTRGNMKCIDKVLKKKINEMSMEQKKKLFNIISTLDE